MLNSIPELLEQSKRLRNILEKSYATSLSLSDCQTIMAQVHKFRNLSEAQAKFAHVAPSGKNSLYISGTNPSVRQAIVAREVRRLAANNSSAILYIAQSSWDNSLAPLCEVVDLTSQVWLPVETFEVSHLKALSRSLVATIDPLGTRAVYSHNVAGKSSASTRELSDLVYAALKATAHCVDWQTLRQIVVPLNIPPSIDSALLSLKISALEHMLADPQFANPVVAPLNRQRGKPLVFIAPESDETLGSPVVAWNSAMFQEFVEEVASPVTIDCNAEHPPRSLTKCILQRSDSTLMVPSFGHMTDSDLESSFMEQVEVFATKPSFKDSSGTFQACLSYLGMKLGNPELAFQLKPYELFHYSRDKNPVLEFLDVKTE